MYKNTIYWIAAFTFIIALIGGSTAAQAASVEPTYIEGNPSCYDLGFTYFIKVDPPTSGTYSKYNDSATFNISTDGTYFDWTSSVGISAVIVKGGPNANIFYYDDSYGDTELFSPDNSSGGPAAISHIEFCFDFDLSVSKTAFPTFDRNYNWTLDKTVSPEAWSLFEGDSGISKYTVSVTKGWTDSNWEIAGAITIYNPAPDPATVLIEDVLSIYGPVTLSDCSPTETISAYGTLVCNYSVGVTDGSTQVNTVTVTSQSPGINSGSDSASAEFTTPTNEYHTQLFVEDTNGSSWTFYDTGSVTYDKTFYCDADRGQHENTVTASYGDTNLSDTATVTVDCYDLKVSKDATTALTRTWEWNISKSVSPEAWHLFTGDTGTSSWTVSVDKTGFLDSDHKVSGKIWIKNPAPIAAELTSVADVIDDTILANVDCGVSFPYVLASGNTLECSYSSALPNAASRTNQASAKLQNYAYSWDGSKSVLGTKKYSFELPFDFTDPEIKHVNYTIDVSDTNGGYWTFNDDDKVSYPETFFCDGDDGNHINTATIVQTKQTASADVSVFCYALAVDKTVTPTFTRAYEWMIVKSADQSELLLSAGQLFAVNYKVSVGVKAITDYDFFVSGEITIQNPSPLIANLTAVIDDMTGYPGVSVSCPSLTVAAYSSLTCTYEQSVADDANRTNLATATLQNYDYDEFKAATPAGTTSFQSPSKDVIFPSEPFEKVDECIDVTDTNIGFLGTICEDSAPTSFTYTLWFGQNPDADIYLDCGLSEHPNNASFITNDTQATGEDNWIVYFDVACDFGCTLTPGYWKTHSNYGPAPYDDTWFLVGEDMPFYSSSSTWYGVLWTPPKSGNAYYILAHAYIAAKMNLLNGASAPGEILTALSEAETLFSSYTPDYVASLKGKNGKELRAEFIDLATLLDDYNNGLIGPGHCSE